MPRHAGSPPGLRQVGQVLVMLLLVTLVPVLIVQAFLHCQGFRADYIKERYAQTDMARAVATAFHSAIGSFADAVCTLGQALLRMEAAEGVPASGFLAAAIHEYPAAEEFIWVDPRGKVLAYSNARSEGGSFDHEECFLRAIRERSWVLGDLQPDPDGKEASFMLARPIMDDRDRIRGVVVARIHADRFAEAYLKIDRLAGAGIVLFDRRGITAFCWPLVQFAEWRQRDSSREEFVAAALKGREVSGKLKMPKTGRYWYVARTPVPDLGWVAGAGLDYESMATPLRRQFVISVGLSILAVLLSAGLAFYYARLIVEDFRQLRNGITAWGRGGLAYCAGSIKSVAELRDLAEAFETMATKRKRAEEALQAQREELAAANDGLQTQAEVLAATNEELEAHREQLAAANQELQMQAEGLALLNQELQKSEECHRALAAELREADQHKNEFLAVLSHELRNPLTSIRNSLSILERAASGSDRAMRAEAIIARQTRQLAHLVDDLLDVTRITQNKVRLQRQRIELNGLVRRTLEDYRVLFEQSGVALATELVRSPVYVYADETRLAQVIGNLLHNAAKFSCRGQSARVVVRRDEAQSRARISVADTGSGIPPEMLPRLFRPFIQADKTLERSRGGLGLGLALVKGIVELHGGEVSAHSDGLGKGSEFVVSLPLAEAQPAEERPVPGGEGVDRQRRVLIIEDNVDLAESLRELLELDAYAVAVAYDGTAGLAKAREFRPEILLCDIGLPMMDGYAVARAFRADETLKGVFLVALTGYALPDDQQRAAAAGFDRHLAKPPDPTVLGKMLAEAPEVG